MEPNGHKRKLRETGRRRCDCLVDHRCHIFCWLDSLIASHLFLLSYCLSGGITHIFLLSFVHRVCVAPCRGRALCRPLIFMYKIFSCHTAFIGVMQRKSPLPISVWVVPCADLTPYTNLMPYADPLRKACTSGFPIEQLC